MISLTAHSLASRLARISHEQKEMFSRQEIVKRINEIKYLSTQKKVPRMSLRKEIIHLENRLQGVFELESQLHKQKKQESYKITTLKKQIETLQKRLEASDDKALQKKVDMLTHLLGDYLAQKGVRREIAVAQAVNKYQERQGVVTREDLGCKLTQLKELFMAASDKASPRARLIQEKIALIENKLGSNSIIQEPAQNAGSQPGVKHTMLFGVQPQLENIVVQAPPTPVLVEMEEVM